jgi:hypothetical protein
MTDIPMRADTDALNTLLHLEQRAQSTATLAVLGFTIANETQALAHYRQAAVFRLAANAHYQLITASGLASVAEDSPFAIWLTRFAQQFPTQPGCHRLDFANAPTAFAEGWEEWLPDHLLVIPLYGPENQPVGLVVYARETPWMDDELGWLARLHVSYGYAFWSLSRQQRTVASRLHGLLLGQRSKWLLLAAVVLFLLPVRLSALAPAEVIALNAVAVAAPQDGVVGQFYVRPNAPVKAGDKLFSLIDTTLANRREVAAKGLSIARADALVAEQRAFDDLKSKGELAAALGRVQEKQAELAAVDALLARVAVTAERDGIAVFTDPNDWLGRPVQTGERVMQLANPQDAGVLVWLPVADALTLEPGAPVRLFLHTQPLSPLNARLLQTSYQATPSPEGIAAYRLRAQFATDERKPRIGLRGTARVSGGWSILGYYLLRRPIAALREWTGL